MKYLILLMFAFSIQSYAQDDQWAIDGGLGVFSTQGTSLSDVKFAKVGIQEDIWDAFKQRVSVGGWLDSRGSGYSGSAFGGYQLGFEVNNSVFQGGIFTGPTLISTTDKDLGGIFQFNDSINFGIKDDRGNVIGIVYNHFSSAGLESPNLGKDFMGLEIKFPF